MPRFQGDNWQHNLGLFDSLKRQPPLVVLAGSSRRKWLEENAVATGVTLSERAKQELDRIFASDAAKGDRYPPGQMRRLGL